MADAATTIRRARDRDFQAVAALDRRAWANSRHGEFIPDGEHAWRIWVEHALVFCAEKDGEILGAVLAFPTQAGTWCLHKVFVEPAARGAGLGGALFERLLSELDARGAEVFLTVDPENAAARALYAGWGFGRAEFVKGYYRPEEDRLVLTRRARP